MRTWSENKCEGILLYFLMALTVLLISRNSSKNAIVL